MTTPLVVGDEIECVNNKDFPIRLKLNKKYRVLDINNTNCHEPMCKIADEIEPAFYYQERFKKVEPAPMFTITENAPNTCYLTAGGYLVTLDNHLIAPPNLCPGETAQGNKTTTGWGWRVGGNIVGLQPAWGEKLQIVKLMDFPIPKPPAGYKYLDGYPQWRAPKAGELYCTAPESIERANVDLQSSYLIISLITKEDCVDITDSHPNLIPRVGIDFYDGGGENAGKCSWSLTAYKCSLNRTISDWANARKFRHYCLPEHVPPKEKAVSTEVIKTGDLVECVDPKHGIGVITKGSKYAVIDHSGGDIIKVKDDRNKELWFAAYKFKKVEKPALLLEHGKTYLTADGYIVPIVKQNGGFFTTVECSPGVTLENKTIHQLNSEVSIRDNKGWLYSESGETHLNEEWNKKLKIVKELPFPLPAAPKGYRYKDGFPRLKIVEPGDIYLVSHVIDKNGLPPKCYGTAANSHNASTSTGGFDSLRLMLEVLPSVVPTAPTLPDGFEWTQNPPEFRKPKKGEFYMGGSEVIKATFDDKYYKSNEWIVRAKQVVVLPPEKYPQYYVPQNPSLFAYIKVFNSKTYTTAILNGEELPPLPVDTAVAFKDFTKLTEEQALARVVKAVTPTPPQITNLCTEISAPQSHLSYWVTEPIGNMYGAVKSSIRYIVISSVLAAVGYTAYNPSGVAKFVKSCLPKITIRYEDVERSKI